MTKDESEDVINPFIGGIIGGVAGAVLGVVAAAFLRNERIRVKIVEQFEDIKDRAFKTMKNIQEDETIKERIQHYLDEEKNLRRKV